MNGSQAESAEELTYGLADGTLNDEGKDHLAALIATDSVARARHRLALEVEFALRRGRTNLDLAAAVMNRLSAERTARVERAVMKAILTVPVARSMGGSPQPRSRRRAVWAVFAASAAMAAAAGAVWVAIGAGDGARSPVADRPSSEGPNLQKPSVPDFAPSVQSPAGDWVAETPAYTPKNRREVTVFSYDFEDGVRPAPLAVDHNDHSLGQVLPAPPGSPSRYAVVGEVSRHGPFSHIWVVQLSGGRGGKSLFSFSHQLFLEFDYWVGPEAKSIAIQIRNEDQKQNYSHLVRCAVHGAWGHATVALTNFRGNVQKDRQAVDGDRILALNMLAGSIGGKPFYVDNLRLFEVIPAAAP
jgi:hypothetical protein